MFNVLDELKKIQKFASMDAEEMEKYIHDLMPEVQDPNVYAAMFGALRARIDMLTSLVESYEHYGKLYQHYNQEGNDDGE